MEEIQKTKGREAREEIYFSYRLPFFLLEINYKTALKKNTERCEAQGIHAYHSTFLLNSAFCQLDIARDVNICNIVKSGAKFKQTKTMNRKTLLAPFLFIALNSCSQQESQSARMSEKDIAVGGSCEGCEAIFENLTPFERLNEVDTLADFNLDGPKLLITGIIYQPDGKTPAPGVVIYIYHTDQKGIYPTKGNEKGWAKRHGYLRGWVKTDSQGVYKFYTLQPAPYPGGGNPAHVHATVKEPGKTAYWIDDFLFEGDPFLPAGKKPGNPRGGNGILKPIMENGLSTMTRNITLGLNVPDYPL